MAHSHWTIEKNGKSYAIPYDVEVKGAQAAEEYLAACEARNEEADRLFGAAPTKEEE